MRRTQSFVVNIAWLLYLAMGVVRGAEIEVRTSTMVIGSAETHQWEKCYGGIDTTIIVDLPLETWARHVRQLLRCSCRPKQSVNNERYA